VKKILISVFILLILPLFSCSKTEKLSIIVPLGAPQIAQIYLQESLEYVIDTVNGPDALVASFGSKSHDFIFAPTNLGAKLYNSEIEYVFIAAITFGNYYLATVTEEDFTVESLNGKEIICFGMNATSDIILRYILDSFNIDVTISYVDSLEMANASLILDNSNIILSAEPALSLLKTKVTGIDTIDLQNEYQEITREGSYPQSGVFAKKSLSDNEINTFLSNLEISIDKVNNQLTQTALLGVELELGFTEETLVSAIPNSNILYMTALDARTDLENYFYIIMEMNPSLIGGSLPDDDFYYS
jgi:NitT/TauT family transport system substrate-binding protein